MDSATAPIQTNPEIRTRIQPYRTVDNVIDGVVLTFANVTERVNAIAAQESSLIAQAIVDAVSSPLLALDGQLKVISANQAFYASFGGEPSLTVGRAIFEITDQRWDVPGVHAFLETPWQAGPGPELRQADVSLRGDGARPFKLDARRVARKPGDRQVLLLSISPAQAAATSGEGPALAR